MKQSKVIAYYIGANSDHPHAADIVTALLENTEIKPEWLNKPEPKRQCRVLNWLTDWIEYDPAPQWPSELVSRIARIDIKAAEWLRDNWVDIDKKYVGISVYGTHRKKLTHLMSWGYTPQGYVYWSLISDQLGEKPC